MKARPTLCSSWARISTVPATDGVKSSCAWPPTTDGQRAEDTALHSGAPDSAPLLLVTTMVVPLGGGLPLVTLRTVMTMVLVSGVSPTSGSPMVSGVATTVMFQLPVPTPPLGGTP